MIRMVTCACSPDKHHPIMTGVYQGAEKREAAEELKALALHLLSINSIAPVCPFCQAPPERWIYEDIETPLKNMADGIAAVVAINAEVNAARERHKARMN